MVHNEVEVLESSEDEEEEPDNVTEPVPTLEASPDDKACEEELGDGETGRREALKERRVLEKIREI